MEKMLTALLGFRTPGAPRGKRRMERDSKDRLLLLCPDRGHSVRKENSVMLAEFGFVSPSELADFKHLHFYGNQQQDS